MEEAKIGNEFQFITKLPEQPCRPDILVPIGHDAAVFDPCNSSIAVSVDTILEGRHFSYDYFTPEQVGMRAIEGAASDIVVAGGVPRYFLVAITASEVETERSLLRIYNGVQTALTRLGSILLGGDTTKGTRTTSMSVTAIGPIVRQPLTRAGGRPGDLLYLSGPVGGSVAGLHLLSNGILGFEEVCRYHLEPHCRVDLAADLGNWAKAAIDISDGLSNEVHHLCAASRCGAIIDLPAIPLKPGVREAGYALGVAPDRFALHGGEEYEILAVGAKGATAPHGWVHIGELAEGDKVLVRDGSGIRPLAPEGFDHFAGARL